MGNKKEGNSVLIADDNMFIRFLVRKWLGTEAEIIEIGNGREIVDIYTLKKPDIVFLDIHLPGKSGKDVLQEIMTLDPSAFVVMLSADSNKENVIFSVRAGAKAFITKPFTHETLYRYYALCPTVTGAQMPATDGESSAADAQG